MKFRTTILLGGKTATGFEVPPEVVESLGKTKRPAVTVTIDGRYTYRSTVAPMGGKFLIPFASEHREATGLNAGDEVEVSLELDTAPREVAVPPALQEALDAAPAAAEKFKSLSYSNQRAIVLQVDGAKTEETRQRRVAKAIETLLAG